MDDCEKEALQKNYKALCADLELDADLEANIVEQRLFTRAQLEEIKAVNTQKGRIQRMLRVLQRRGPKAFDKFLICIQDDYSWLAENLRRSYQEETNNTQPPSADLGHSEDPEQVILRKVFSMLTNEKTNDATTEPFNAPADVSLDMMESKITHMSEKLRSLEKQVDDCYKALNISDKTKSLDEIIKDLAAQNKSRHIKIARLQKDLRQKVWFIQQQSEQIENLNYKIEANQEEKARFQKELQRKDGKIKELSEKIQKLNSEIKASQKEIKEVNEKIQNQNYEIKASQEKIPQLQKEQAQKPTIVQEQSTNIQIPNSKCKDLNMKCKRPMQINSHHQQSTFSSPHDIQRVPLQRFNSVHEEVQDNGTKFPIIHLQKNISQQKKRSKFERNSCPDGIGSLGASSSQNKNVWRL